MTPGEYLLDVDAGPVEANAGRRTARVVVKNAGDRPIQAGSHFHFLKRTRLFCSIVRRLTECG